MKLATTTQISFRTISIATALALFAILALAFVLFQARYLLLGPQVTLIDPPTIQQNERQITLTGTARNISHLWLNDRQIYTDQTGTFTETVVLENGYTVITLRAEDRYGRTATVAHPVSYTAATFAQQ